MPLPQLILASGSPQRKKLLTAAGYTFDIFIPDDSAECGICSSGGPAALVAELAERKAQDVAKRLNQSQPDDLAESLLIACDTVAECDGTILGKPRDEDHAQQMLEKLRGTKHRVYSGLCIMPLNAQQFGPQETRIAVTELSMDNISESALDEYLDSGLWKGKAGAFGYQDRTNWLHIHEGSESNVIGLPMELLAEMLAERGYA